MIRKCKEKDYNQLIDFLQKEPEFNLFIIADLEKYGFEYDFLTVWADFKKKDKKIKAVLLKYYSSFIYFSEKNYNKHHDFVDILEKQDQIKVLSGKYDRVEPLAQLKNFADIRKLIFSVLKQDNFNPVLSSGNYEVEKAGVEDAEDIFSLRKKIKEFDIEGSVKKLKKRIKDGFGRTYFVKKDNKVISAASTTAECSYSAMIGGVMTHPDYRRKGLASKCISKLCKELLEEGKSPCLFYDNPQAGSIYKKLGFANKGSYLLAK